MFIVKIQAEDERTCDKKLKPFFVTLMLMSTLSSCTVV